VNKDNRPPQSQSQPLNRRLGKLANLQRCAKLRDVPKRLYDMVESPQLVGGLCRGR
jgi:hypothetical protein